MLFYIGHHTVTIQFYALNIKLILSLQLSRMYKERGTLKLKTTHETEQGRHEACTRTDAWNASQTFLP